MEDPLFKESDNVRCLEKLEQLPKLLGRMMHGGGGGTGGDDEVYAIEEEDPAAPIYVKVVRPTGTGYTVIDLPGAWVGGGC
jgi:hypothetical protein